MAISFVGGNPRVNLGSVSALSGASAMTVAGWIRLADVNADATIAIRGNSFGAAAPWIFWRDDVGTVSGRVNTLAVLLNTNVGQLRVEGSSNLLNDTSSWHHVAMVFAAGESEGIRVYVDGVKDVQVLTTIGHSHVVDNTSDVTLGFDSVAAPFLGEMADMSLWDVALSDAEIAKLAAGFATLTIARSGRWPVNYHDMIRSLDRPGIGAEASTVGTLGVVAHPPLRFPSSQLSTVSKAHPLVPTPWRADRGVTLGNAAAAGELFIPDAARGAVHPIGEVHP